MNVHALVLASCMIALVAPTAGAAGADNGPLPSDAMALATSSQDAFMASASGGAITAGANSAADIGASGLLNVQQNTGSNSVLQSANILAAILDCSCTSGGPLTSQANTTQAALILGDITVRTPYGLSTTPTGTTQDLPQRSSAIAQRGSNTINNIGGGPGLYNVSQNTGSNAVLQSANAVAEIEGIAQSRGTTIPAH